MGQPRLLERWTIFNLVGFAGMAVQLALVAFMVRFLGWHYLLATGLAVEAAVLHNFAWHHRWTWKDRPPSSARGLALRLGRFHLLNGAVSFAGNIGLTAVLTGVLHIDPVVSNLIAIAVCAGINFAGCNVVVFRSAPIGALLMLSLAPAPAIAGPAPSTLAAWRAYEAGLDAEYAAASSAPSSRFLAHDRFALSPGWRRSVMQGTPSILKIDAASIDDGKIHHWVGALFVPGVTVEGAIERVQQSAGRESDSYEDVLASRLIERNGNRARVFMKLRRQSVITVTYNTEHVIEYTRISGARALVRSVAARITELADAGTAQEREKPANDDSGFLWRLNAYWRYEAVPGGVVVECESVSLSRAVPLLVRPVASPIVDRIARESLNRTLSSLRRVLAGATHADALGAFPWHLSLARGAWPSPRLRPSSPKRRLNPCDAKVAHPPLALARGRRSPALPSNLRADLGRRRAGASAGKPAPRSGRRLVPLTAPSPAWP